MLDGVLAGKELPSLLPDGLVNRFEFSLDKLLDRFDVGVVPAVDQLLVNVSHQDKHLGKLVALPQVSVEVSNEVSLADHVASGGVVEHLGVKH